MKRCHTQKAVGLSAAEGRSCSQLGHSSRGSRCEPLGGHTAGRSHVTGEDTGSGRRDPQHHGAAHCSPEGCQGEHVGRALPTRTPRWAQNSHPPEFYFPGPERRGCHSVAYLSIGPSVHPSLPPSFLSAVHWTQGLTRAGGAGGGLYTGAIS